MWDNLINKFIEKKIYIFTISVAMIIFYSINDEILGKFSAFHFKQEYGGFVFILALFFWVLSVLIVCNYLKNFFLEYCNKRQFMFQKI